MALPTKPNPIIKDSASPAASIAVLDAPAPADGDTSELFTPDDSPTTEAESLDIFTPAQPVSVDHILAQQEEEERALKAALREELANEDAVLAAMAGRPAGADVSDLKKAEAKRKEDGEAGVDNFINVMGGVTKAQAEAMERKAEEKAANREKFKTARKALIIWSFVALGLIASIAAFVISGVSL